MRTGQRVDFDHSRHAVRGDDQLRNTVTRAHHERRCGISVPQDDLNFSAEARIDNPGGVDQGNTVLNRQPASGCHPPQIPGRQSDLHPGRDQLARERSKFAVDTGDEVHSGVTRVGVAGWLSHHKNVDAISPVHAPRLYVVK